MRCSSASTGPDGNWANRKQPRAIYGLSEAQVRELFRKPITLRFGSFARGTWSQVNGAYGVRIYGD